MNKREILLTKRIEYLIMDPAIFKGNKKERTTYLTEIDFYKNASVKLDDPVKNQYRIDLSGKSFDRFIEIVGPYIEPNFFDRVPTPRVEGSRYGSMTASELKKYLGITYTNRVAFKKLIETYPN